MADDKMSKSVQGDIIQGLLKLHQPILKANKAFKRFAICAARFEKQRKDFINGRKY